MCGCFHEGNLKGAGGLGQVWIPQQGSEQLPGQHLLTDYFCTDHSALITGLTAWTFLAGFLVGHK